MKFNKWKKKVAKVESYDWCYELLTLLQYKLQNFNSVPHRPVRFLNISYSIEIQLGDWKKSWLKGLGKDQWINPLSKLNKNLND